MPPFWQSWWFIGLLGLFLAGVIVGGVRLRLKSLVARSHDLEKLVHERTGALEQKTLELQQRHNKFEDTPYALEPNCKESPGGLRDLQVVIWVARAAGLGRTWAELAANGLLTPFEVRRLHRILWINVGLDGLYIAAGLTLLAWGPADPIWRGHGWGIIAQGAHRDSRRGHRPPRGD